MCYLLLAQVDTLNLPFEWMYLAVVGAAAVVFLVISLIIGAAANKNKQIALMYEEVREEEDALAELIEKDAAFTPESLTAATEAYEIEKELELKKANPEPAKRTLIKLPVAVPEKVKNNVHKIVPVAAICTAVAAVFAVSSARKRAAAEKRSAAARRDFFKWLG